MLSEIIVYEINIKKYKKILFLFKKKEELTYRLTYRIDEDRLWFYKLLNNKLIEDHLMKQDLTNSINTMTNILDRFDQFNSLLVNKCIINTFNLYDANYRLYSKIEDYSNTKREYYREKKSNGFYLSDDLSL
jgi:hypothetical protein